MRLVWLLVPVAIGAGLLAVTGDADDPEPIVIKRYHGGPPAIGLPPDGVAASIGGGGLHVSTYGSSSCPNVPVSVTVSATQTIDVVAPDLGGGQPIGGRTAYACTDDLGPTTAVVSLPEQIDPGQPVTVVVTGDDRVTRTVELPGE